MCKFNFKIKKVISSLLLVILLINQQSYSAIVSDNDGSAFVTKSEFESLKDNFKSQVENYNSSIDARIDGAIAAYLAGMRLATIEEQDSLLNTINDSCDDSYTSGESTVKYGYRCMAKSYTVPTTQEPVGAITGAFFHHAFLYTRAADPFGGGWQRVSLDSEHRGSINPRDIPTSGRKNGKYILVGSYKNKFYSLNDVADICYRYYITGDLAGHDHNAFPDGDDNWEWNMPEFKNEDKTWSIRYVDIGGRFPTKTSSWMNQRCFYGATYEMSKNKSVLPVAGMVSGNIYVLENDKLKTMTLQRNSYNWTWLAQAQMMYYKKSGSTWNAYTLGAPTNTVQSTFYFNCHPYEQVALSNLIDYNASRIYGDDNVAIYGGLPIFKASNHGKVTMKITFMSVSNSDVYIGLKKQQFANDDTDYSIQSDLNLRNEKDEKYTSNKFQVNKEYTFVMDVKKDETVWLRTYDSTSNTGFTGAKTGEISLEVD